MREIVVRIQVDDDTACPQDVYECANLLYGICKGQVEGYVSSIYDETTEKF